MVDLARSNRIVPILGTELTIFGIKGYPEKIKIFLLEKIVQKESHRTYVNKHVLRMNEWLKSFAREEKLMIVDFNRALSGKDGVRKEEYTTPDGTHISSEGYQELTRYINQALKDQVR
jgi:lysophospholipase L1-like esterase